MTSEWPVIQPQSAGGAKNTSYKPTCHYLNGQLLRNNLLFFREHATAMEQAVGRPLKRGATDLPAAP